MHTLEVSTNASIVRQSNYHLKYLICGTGGTPYYNAFFGAGTGPIYLNYVYCTLSASQLLECSSRPILSHNCDHRADAGVGCEGKFVCQSFKNSSKATVGQQYTSYMFHCSSLHNWSTATSRR